MKCEKHPNADKLSVCEVDTGKERVQVVCGAPNARAGMKGVFAPVGSYVPGIDLTLTKAKIRGVELFGMLLSERELNSPTSIPASSSSTPRPRSAARRRRRSGSTMR